MALAGISSRRFFVGGGGAGAEAGAVAVDCVVLSWWRCMVIDSVAEK